MYRTAALLIAALLLVAPSQADAASVDKDPSSSCSVRVHYPNPVPSGVNVFVLAVGTAMSRTAYDNLAEQLVAKNYVAVIMDHQKGNMTKTDAGKFTSCVKSVKAQIASWLNPAGFKSASHWILGGHSAGGQAAHYAIAATPSLADAIFSIDPYNLSSAPAVHGPALYWGFTGTTCFVTVSDAAKAAYLQTSGHRVEVKVGSVYSFNPCGYAPKYYHCSFTDASCPACTNCRFTPSYFFTDIANTVQKFVNAAFYSGWTRSALTVSTTTPVTFYVDGDQP